MLQGLKTNNATTEQIHVIYNCARAGYIVAAGASDLVASAIYRESRQTATAADWLGRM
jgi:hypothetical protein